MFRRHKDYERGGGSSVIKGIFGIFRMILSLLIMGILFLGIYQAYKSFSGIDPLKADPKAVLNNILASEDAYSVLNDLLSADPRKSFDKARGVVGLGQQQPPTVAKNGRYIQRSPFLFSFAVVTDSHNDNQDLAKALQMAKQRQVRFVIGLGDYTDVGTTDELLNAKVEFDRSGLPYYTTVGDHDLWDSRNRKLAPIKNFSDIFGTPYQSFSYQNTRFILLYNSDNYLGVDGVELNWIEEQLKRVQQDSSKLIFVFPSIPLYHPSSDHVMGKTEEKLKNQADNLISLFHLYNITEVISGDTHFFSQYTEPKFGLKMTTVGAVTQTRNAQKPRFAIVDVYEDGGYNIDDIEIN